MLGAVPKVACLLALAGTALSTVVPNTTFPYQHFRSTNAAAPVLQITKSGAPLSPGLLFFEPQVLTPSSLIMSDSGELIWCGPVERGLNPTPGTLFGKPVLSRWVGYLVKGLGYGAIKILDDTYTQIYNICPVFGIYAPSAVVKPQCEADTHELTISDHNTLVVTANNITQTDLSSKGGPKNGWIIDGQFYEIDIATGKTLFGWSSIQHVPINESVNTQLNGTGTTPYTPYDYFHINSVQPLDGGYYIVNGRYVSAFYMVGPHGHIEWTFNGYDGGDFGPLPANGKFAFQHDVRGTKVKDGWIVHFFNNDNSEVRKGQDQSTGMEWFLDTKHWCARLLRNLADPKDPLYTIAQGSYNPQPNGNVVVDYGQIPIFKEYGPHSNSDVRLTILYANTTSNGTYRVFKSPWSAVPAYPPSLFVDKDEGKVYASWNGATTVTSWRLYSGSSSTNLRQVGHFLKTGFESSYKLKHKAATDTYFQVAALSHRKVLKNSAIVQAS